MYEVLSIRKAQEARMQASKWQMWQKTPCVMALWSTELSARFAPNLQKLGLKSWFGMFGMFGNDLKWLKPVEFLGRQRRVWPRIGSGGALSCTFCYMDYPVVSNHSFERALTSVRALEQATRYS